MKFELILSPCFLLVATVLAVFVGCAVQSASAQKKEIVWSAEEKPIADKIQGLRGLADDVRAGTTKDLALKIRKLPSTENKLPLAVGLAGLSTEGDFGHDTLQEVATTLAETLRERPVPWVQPEKSDADDSAPTTRTPAYPYVELATLVRYEHVEAPVNFDDEQYCAAIARLEADDLKRQHPEFTLTDITGKKWKFSDLGGKVVLVNFWATWCPPCRKEMPDLDALYKKFRDQGLVILAIDDEDVSKIKPFLAEHPVAYPILLDPGRKVNDVFHIDGIPKSFVYDREGKLVAQSIDMRTQKQFLEMLAQAGLR